MESNWDLDLESNTDLDLDLDLDEYLLHPQPAPCLRITHAFMRADRAIEHVCEETVAMENGVLRQEQLIWCIKRQQQQQFGLSRTHFKLRAMFLYNMDLEAEEVPDFVQTTTAHLSHRFITPISAVEDVAVQPTIPMFAHLNALYIVYEAGPSNPSNPSNQSKKRVVIHSKNLKRTRRTK